MATCPACANPAPEGAASCPLCGFNLALAASAEALSRPGVTAPRAPRPGAPRAPRPPTQFTEAATAESSRAAPPQPAPSVAAPPTASMSSSLAGTDPADPYLGRTIAGKFQIIDLLGQGGMGKVYKARHVTLEKTICIKTLRPALLEDPTVVGRFEREAKSASRLNHANSIQVLDFGQDEYGALYIAMEFVSGKDLRKTLRDEFPLGELRICHIIAQVLSALAEAHAQHVIHRDLKPENIMLEQRRGEPDFVKVLDFGIAKINEPDVPGLTRADVVCGTPLYMSPEQATGSAFDARADLYSIGVILYQLCTGTLPFEGQNSMEILTKHVTELPVPPRTRRPEVSISPDMEALILRAMDKDPAKRPANAEEFRAEILRISDKLRRAKEDAEEAAKNAASQHKAERAQAMKEKQEAQRALFAGKSAPDQAATELVKRPSKAPLIAGAVAGVAVIAGGAFALLHKSEPPTHPDSVPVAVRPQPVTPPPAAVTPPPAVTPSPTQVAVTPPPTATKPPEAVTPPVHHDAEPVVAHADPKPPHQTTPVSIVDPPKNLPPLAHGDSVRAKAYKEEADLEVEEGNYANAETVYRNAIKADPSFSGGYYGLYRTGLMTKNKKLIREGGEGFLRADPHAPQAGKIRESLGEL